MRVLVCGGRDFYDWIMLEDFFEGFDRTLDIEMIIQGEASGADKLAKQWAKYQGVETMDFPAIWRNVLANGKFNPNAGPERNQKMLDEGKPDLVVAFSGGKGTANMVKLAQAAGIEVIKVGW